MYIIIIAIHFELCDCTLYCTLFVRCNVRSSSEFNSILYAPKCFIHTIVYLGFSLPLAHSSAVRRAVSFYSICHCFFFIFVFIQLLYSRLMVCVSLVYIFRAILCLAIPFFIYIHIYSYSCIIWIYDLKVFLLSILHQHHHSQRPTTSSSCCSYSV